MRVEQVLLTQPGVVTDFRLANLLDFYARTIASLMGAPDCPLPLLFNEYVPINILVLLPPSLDVSNFSRYLDNRQCSSRIHTGCLSLLVHLGVNMIV